MSQQEVFYQQLVERYTHNQATAEELEVFFSLLQQGKLDAVLEAQMNREAGITAAPAYQEAPATPAIIPPARHKRTLVTWMAAAAVFLLVAGSVWWWNTRPAGPSAPLTAKQDILPGASRATLTLEDGKQMLLDTASNGVLVQQQGASVTVRNGSLAYSGHKPAGSIPYNILTTHKGEQYRLTLSDGTTIVADASTTIRFPVTFTGTSRMVELNGHAWFEVAPDAHKPFYVKKGEEVVQVLGTSFDMQAYDNEKEMTVTLVTGRVRVQHGAASCVLEPGQQAIAGREATARLTVVPDADIEQATAWMNGKMVFRNADISTIMRSVERWYNIEVDIPASLLNRSFYFAVNRSAPLSELLHFLEVYHIRYTLNIQTRKLTLMP